jgi:hypothetical protein
MPDNVVKIEFQADDASTTAAFSRLNSEVNSLGGAGMGKAQSAMADWRKETGLAEVATMGTSNALVNLSSKVGKTAADFRPATAAQREASVASREAGDGFDRLAGQVVALGLAYKVAQVAIAATKYVIGSQMKFESAAVRFKNLAGNTKEAAADLETLKAVSKDTNTNVVELLAADTTLREAGRSGLSTHDDMEALAKNARSAGTEVGQLADAYLRLGRGEVSGRDLAMVIKLTGDESGKLQSEFREMSVTIPRMAKDMEVFQRATERSRQDADRLATRSTQDANLAVSRQTHDRDLKLSAQTSFGEAHGGADIFKAFQQGGSVSNLPGMHGGQGAIQAVMAQLREGVSQIGKEEGLASEDTMQLVRSGAIGNEELLQAGGRAREARETKAARGREDTDTSAARGREDAGTTMSRANEDERTNLELRKEFLKKDLIERAQQGLLGASPDIDKKYANYANTTQGRADAASLEVKTAAQGAGDGLHWLSSKINEVTKAVTGYDAAAHPLKGSEMPVHADKAKKPGEPGYDWGQYKPPADNTKAKENEKNNEDVVKAITGIIDKLNAIFVSGQ